MVGLRQQRTFRLGSFSLGFGVLSALVLAATTSACGDDDANVGGGNTPDAGEDVTQMDSDVPNPPTASRLSRPSHGSTIDISEDDKIIVTANRDVGTVTVFEVAYTADLPPTLTKKAEVQVGGEPYQVALTPDGNRAFVVLRKDQKLVRVDNLRTAPAKGPEVAVGSEPTGVALTPRARTVFVANWMDGTVSEVDAEKMTVTSTIDLNAALVGSGVLGQNITPRPALAHPRSLAVTNNNDDIETDETLFVTEYYGQWKEALAPTGANADIAKQGLVYQIKLADKKVSTVALPPMADIGIKDHAGNAVGCYPNQLQSINITGSFAYVLSICASPKGPLGDYLGPAKAVCNDDTECPGQGAGSCDTVAKRCKTNCATNAECGLEGVCKANVCEENLIDSKGLQTPAVSVIDIGGSKTIASVSLNGEFEKLFIARNVPDTTDRRFPLHAIDMGFVPGSLKAYLPANGADAVYRVDFNATYQTKAIDSVGSEARPFIALDRGTLDATKQGKLPVGIAVAHKAKANEPNHYAFVMNDGSRNITAIDLTTDDIAGTTEQPAVTSYSAMPTDAVEAARLEGRRLFETGLGRWSFRGQAWGACSTCHWEGLSDQVTWFHRRGARQSPSVDQTINSKNPNDIRAMNWQASSDELADNENGALRVVLGGVGAIVKGFDISNDARIDFAKYGHSGLSGSITTAADPASPSTLVGEVCVLDDWKKIDVYEKSLRTPRRPSNLDAAKVAAGKDVFLEGKCQGCHGGEKWTLSRVFYTPDAIAQSADHTNVNNALKSRSWSTTVEDANFPTALLPTLTTAAQTMRYNGSNSSSFDVLTCLLRNVGTFNVAEPNVGIAELRRDMTTAAQGNEDYSKGYNVPSLLGMGVAAPYFHAGNARTLEAALSETFATHLRALKPGFLSGSDAATKREALVQFLLSLDEDAASIALPAWNGTLWENDPLPALGPDGGDFCSAP